MLIILFGSRSGAWKKFYLFVAALPRLWETLGATLLIIGIREPVEESPILSTIESLS
jgi:hypothetical protein